MCFSASSSFAAGGALVLLGAAAFRMASRENRLLSAIPLLFGIQQVAEGIQWLRLHQGTFSPAAGYVFLIIALVTWPVYLPGAVLLLDRRRWRLHSGFLALGSVIALYFATLLLTQPLSIREYSGSIRYAFGFDRHLLVMPAYIIAVGGPLMASSIGIFKGFGAGIAVLAFVAWKFYNLNFLSVWCFFAALVSSAFFAYLYRARAVTRRTGP